jgi:hypothetical protein
MTTYAFDVILAGEEVLTDEIGNRLYAAGCDDSSPGSCNGVVSIHFDREAASLEEAIRSAVANVKAAGYKVAHVLIASDADVLAV